MLVAEMLDPAQAEYGYSEEGADKVLDDAVHDCVLEIADGNKCECIFPIPSSHTYMSCGRDKEAALSKLRQSTDAKLGDLFPVSRVRGPTR